MNFVRDQLSPRKRNFISAGADNVTIDSGRAKKSCTPNYLHKLYLPSHA